MIILNGNSYKLVAINKSIFRSNITFVNHLPQDLQLSEVCRSVSGRNNIMLNRGYEKLRNRGKSTTRVTVKFFWLTNCV